MFHYLSLRKTINFFHLSLDFQSENTTAGQNPPPNRIQRGNFIHGPEVGPKIRAKVKTVFQPVNQGAEGAAKLTGTRLPFTTKTLQTSQVNVKTLNSLEVEPTPALPNPALQSTGLNTEWRGCVMTQWREPKIIRCERPLHAASSPCALPVAWVTLYCNGQAEVWLRNEVQYAVLLESLFGTRCIPKGQDTWVFFLGPLKSSSKQAPLTRNTL